MSYLVLARKYRPKTFSDVVGQSHVTRPLVNALKSGRIAHAFLFSGARGVGKTTTARLLAMALNCEEKSDPPCGDCEICREISEGHAVDVYEIDGASNRGINEIRDLRETIKYLPSRGDYKVYIIDEVHMLTKEAFNALLKTLEEPPGHVVFIFATTEAHKVLPTILSRCQRYDFKRIGLQEIVGRLDEIARSENIQTGPNVTRVLARESDGSLRDALSLFDQVIAFAGTEIKDEEVHEALGLIDQELITGMARALLSGDAGTALDLLDKAYNFGHDTKEFASQILNYFRSLVVAKVSRAPENILDVLDAELEEIKALAGETSLETLNFQFNAWLDVQDKVHRSGQPRMVLEALVVRLAQVQPIQPLAELMAKLEALLDSAGPGPGPGPGTVPPSGSGGPSQPPPGRSGPDRQGGPPSSRLFTPPDPPGMTDSFMESVPNEPDMGGPAPGDYTMDVPPQAADTSPAEYTVEYVANRNAVHDGPSENTGANGALDWPGFMDVMRANHPLQANFLEQARVRDFEPTRVSLTIGQPEAMNILDKGVIVERLTEFFGRRPAFEIDLDAEATPEVGAQPASGDGKTAGQIQDDREQIKQDILDHPLIRETQKILEMELIEIIPES